MLKRHLKKGLKVAVTTMLEIRYPIKGKALSLNRSQIHHTHDNTFIWCKHTKKHYLCVVNILLTFLSILLCLS